MLRGAWAPLAADQLPAQSTLGRTAVRQIETLYMAQSHGASGWRSCARPSRAATAEYFRAPETITGSGTGFWEAPRGALYHSRGRQGRQDRPVTRSSSRPPGTLPPSTPNGEHGPRWSRRSSACRWATSRSPSTLCAPFTASIPARPARCTCTEPATGKQLRDRHEPLGGEVRWPILAHYREAHPLPFVITHWINLVAMILLIITGF